MSREVILCLAEVANFLRSREVPFFSAVLNGECDREYIVVDIGRMAASIHPRLDRERILRQFILEKLKKSGDVFGFPALTVKEISEVLSQVRLAIR